MNSKLTIGVVSVIVIAASFYSGMKYDQSSNTATLMNFSRRDGTRSMGISRLSGAGRGMNGGFVSGEVLSIDDKSITLKIKDGPNGQGGSKIILFSGATSVMKSDTGLISDITVGKQISVTGSANTDGIVTAESIQIRPTLTTNK